MGSVSCDTCWLRMSHTSVTVFHKQTEHYWFFCFLVLTKNITDLPHPHFCLFAFHWFKSRKGTALQGFCVQWPLQQSCFRNWQEPCHCFHGPELLFSRSLWFCLVCLQALLCCVLLCTHKHISFPSRTQFHLGHKHLQFKEQLCALSGSGDLVYSQLKWICTIAVPSRPQESASKVNSKNFPHLHRYQDGRKSLFIFCLKKSN